MEQLSLFSPEDPSLDGAIWWEENRECRNWNGYFQYRENGRGTWMFVVVDYGDSDAVIYKINNLRKFYRFRVPIDEQNRLLIEGKLYDRIHWID